MIRVRHLVVLSLAVAAIPVGLVLAGELAPHEAARAVAAVLVGALVVFALGPLRASPRLERVLTAPVARRPHEPLVDLAALERTLRLCTTAADVQWRLRPVLCDVARGLLRERHGVDLDRHRRRAETLLGSDLYEVVRPDRPDPEHRAAPSGLTEPIVAGFVERLGAL